MRCLACWTNIRGGDAIYTKSCNHVFCQTCSEKSFKKELSCPLCDTVLPKDGIGVLTVQPDDPQLAKVASKAFGFEPAQLCSVLQMGLEFWTKQKQNESIKYHQDIRSLTNKVKEKEGENAKLSKVLEEERLKNKSLRSEKESLKGLISELETRYAEKTRSLRKLSELYNELRQVHRRLETDLRCVRDNGDFDPDEVRPAEMEVKTVGRSLNRDARKDDHRGHERQAGGDGERLAEGGAHTVLRERSTRDESRTRARHERERHDDDMRERHDDDVREPLSRGMQRDVPAQAENYFTLAPRDREAEIEVNEDDNGRRRSGWSSSWSARRRSGEFRMHEDGSTRRLSRPPRSRR